MKKLVKINNNKVSLNLSGIVPGIYLLQIEGKSSVEVKKLVKQ